MHDASFADDDPFIISLLQQQLHEAVSTACAIIDNKFRRYGLMVNYKPSKAEAMIYYGGSKAHKARVTCHECIGC